MAGEDYQIRALMFQRAVAEAAGFGLSVVQQDFARPWGGFLRFRESDIDVFLHAFWQGVDTGPGGGRRDPKLLLVRPGCRLSLQRHQRRHELWRVLDGPLLVLNGAGPLNLNHDLLFSGDVIRLPQGVCHRPAASLTSWARIAEIWEHCDPLNPSDEDDIQRLHDDYGRF